MTTAPFRAENEFPTILSYGKDTRITVCDQFGTSVSIADKGWQKLKLSRLAIR